jgi:hypothetical protein
MSENKRHDLSCFNSSMEGIHATSPISTSIKSVWNDYSGVANCSYFGYRSNNLGHCECWEVSVLYDERLPEWNFGAQLHK